MTPALLAALWTLPGVVMLAWFLWDDSRSKKPVHLTSYYRWLNLMVVGVWLWPAILGYAVGKIAIDRYRTMDLTWLK